MDLLNIQPIEFYRNFLNEKIRPDGRSLLEARKIVLNVGPISTANGSAMVKLGETMLICGIKAELTVPPAEEPDKGLIVPNLELPPLCSSNFRPGPPCDQAQIITKFLDNLVKSCNLVDTRDLCIVHDKFVWVLYCDIVCLNYDGNALDASVIALSAALQNVELPSVTVDSDTNLPLTDFNDLRTLRINCLPSPITFTVFEGKKIIADPTSKEEEVTMGTCSVVTDEKENIIYLERSGGIALSQAKVQNCIQKAIKHGVHVRKLYKAVRKPDK